MTNYAGCHNDFEAPIDAKNNGVFYLNSRVRYEDIEDGASNTIFFGEKLTDDSELGWASGTRATLRNMGSAINLGLGAIKTLPSAPTKPDEDDAGNSPDLKATGKPGVKATEEANKPFVGSFGSRHPGGANFGFGDGSVRFLKNSMSTKIRNLLANRADGDLLSSDQF